MFGLRSWGNISGIILLVSLGIVTFAALGLIVASVTNTMQETQIINQILWWGFMVLSGFPVPLAVLPSWLQNLAAFQPATYLVAGLERVMVGQVGVSRIAPELLSLALSATIAFVVSQQLFRWEPEAKAPRRAKLWAATAVIPFLLMGVWESSNEQAARECTPGLPLDGTAFANERPALNHAGPQRFAVIAHANRSERTAPAGML